jgi:hypothetical protein
MVLLRLLSSRSSAFASLTVSLLILSLAAVCLAGEAKATVMETQTDGAAAALMGPIRKLLQFPSIPIPIGQGRCAGTFTREWIPCYISEYSIFSSLG